MCKKDSGGSRFGQRVGQGFKDRGQTFVEGLKNVFLGVRGISKEQWEELSKEIILSRQKTGDEMDTDKDGGITTNDIAKGFKKEKKEEK